MRSKSVLVAVLVVAALVCLAGISSAQSVINPGGYSSQQYVDAESPATQSAPQTLSRPDFRLMGLAMMWSQLAWAPASPMHLPSALALVSPGDRRWGLR